MVAIIDYGVGNLFSLSRSLTAIGAESVVTNDAAVIAGASHVILPGVGAFADAYGKLCASGMDKAVYAAADRGKGRCSAYAWACSCSLSAASSTASTAASACSKATS